DEIAVYRSGLIRFSYRNDRSIYLWYLSDLHELGRHRDDTYASRVRELWKSVSRRGLLEVLRIDAEICIVYRHPGQRRCLSISLRTNERIERPEYIPGR